MGNLAPIFLYCLFTLLIQGLAATRKLDSIDQKTIDRLYNFEDVNTSGLWYDVRKGMTKPGNKPQKVMMKIAKYKKNIETEIDVLRALYSRSGNENLLPYNIANVLHLGVYEDKRTIIFDLLGDDFQTLLSYGSDNNPQYNMAICLWAKQMIEALRFLHQHGHVHRDIQPKNIAEGVEFFDPNRTDVSFKGRAYLCNFGLGFMYKYTNGTIKKREIRSKLDVTPYSSRDAMKNHTQYPRDDIESLGYTMLRLAGNKELPWFNSSGLDMLREKIALFESDQRAEEVCKAMGITDVGMINVFKNFYQLIRFKYFADDDYKREIDYDDLSDCFVYPTRDLRYIGLLNQYTIDKIYNNSRLSTNVAAGEQYFVVRMDGAMVTTAIRDENLISNGIKAFKDLYTRSEQENLLPFNIVNMLGYGLREGKKIIISDCLWLDYMVLSENNGLSNPEYYFGVCFWAQQMIKALKFLHHHGYVHRDIQPRNIAAGAEDFNLNRTDVAFKGSAYLFNLGAADKYKHDNGTIKQRAKYSSFPYETSPYTSRHALYGFTHYPRDDMEELGYTMLTVTAGVLPWPYFEIDRKNNFFRSDQMVEDVCKGMGMVDMGMINIFKSYFGLLRFKYFSDDDYSREIDYEELCACFEYPKMRI